MLKKIIAATVIVAILANASLIAHANESKTEVTGNEPVSESVEAATETTDEKSAETSMDEIKAFRNSLRVKVYDVVSFGDRMNLYDKDENIIQVGAGEEIYIVGSNDERQHFRVIAPEQYYVGILHLKYEDVKEAETYTFIISHDGLVIGDFNIDGRVDVFDLCLMKRGFIYGWDDKLSETLADMNDDGEISIADVIWLQQWLLGIIK